MVLVRMQQWVSSDCKYDSLGFRKKTAAGPGVQGTFNFDSILNEKTKVTLKHLIVLLAGLTQCFSQWLSPC